MSAIFRTHSAGKNCAKATLGCKSFKKGYPETQVFVELAEVYLNLRMNNECRSAR
jgi:hypothetical protein